MVEPHLSTTPDVTLFRLREHCQRIVANAGRASTAALMAAQMFLTLDATLTQDGVLPLDWSGASRSLVLNGMPKQPNFTGFTLVDAFADDEEDGEEFLEV